MKNKFIFITIFSIIILIIIISFVILDIRFLTINGTSMNPSITRDDIIFISPVDAQSLKIGDVITYRRIIGGNGVTITHRIIYIHDGIIRTKGDNLEFPDRQDIVYKDVVGKVVAKIPYVGYLIRFVRSNIGYLIFIFIPTILLVIKEIKNMIQKSK